MSSIVTVPTELVGPLRTGSLSALADAAQGIADLVALAERYRGEAWQQKAMERLDRIRMLLDLIGWKEPRPAAAAQVDLHEHRVAFLEALDMALAISDAEIEEIAAVDAARAARREPPTRESTIKRAGALHEFASAVSEDVASMEALARAAADT